MVVESREKAWPIIGFRHIAGIQTWDAGEIRVSNRPLEKAGRRQVGYMPETTAFPKELRVDAFLRFACVAKGIKGDWRAEVERECWRSRCWNGCETFAALLRRGGVGR